MFSMVLCAGENDLARFVILSGMLLVGAFGSIGIASSFRRNKQMYS